MTPETIFVIVTTVIGLLVILRLAATFDLDEEYTDNDIP